MALHAVPGPTPMKTPVQAKDGRNQAERTQTPKMN
jgi:hypothetical protein